MNSFDKMSQREAEFRKDLNELLDNHRAKLIITDDGKPYGLHSSGLIIEMDGSLDYDNDNLDLPYTEFEW